MEKAVTYKRRQEEGTLTLRGSVDIFEAVLLYAAAQRAASDGKASVVCVDFAGVERLDVSSVQLLMALRRDVTAAGRAFTMRGNASLIAKTFAPLGVALQP